MNHITISRVSGSGVPNGSAVQIEIRELGKGQIYVGYMTFEEYGRLISGQGFCDILPVLSNKKGC